MNPTTKEVFLKSGSSIQQDDLDKVLESSKNFFLQQAKNLELMLH